MLCRHHQAVASYWQGIDPGPFLDKDPCYAGKSFAVVDLELTAAASQQGRVVEVGVVLLDDWGQEEDQWSTLVNPQIPFGENVHGLFEKDVSNAPAFPEIAESLFGILSGRVLVAHQADVEASVLGGYFSEAGLYYNPTTICTKENSWLLNPPSKSLQSLCSFLAIENKKPHTALSDARATTALFQHLWLKARLSGAPLLKLAGPCPVD